jgi:hypothetical protein
MNEIMTPKRGRPSQKQAVTANDNAKQAKRGRPAGRKFTDYLHVMLRPEDREAINWLMTHLHGDASSIVRALIHAEKKRIGEPGDMAQKR